MDHPYAVLGLVFLAFFMDFGVHLYALIGVRVKSFMS